MVLHFESPLFVLQVLTRCIKHEALHPSWQTPQRTPWTSACPAPSSPCPKDPAVRLLGSTSLGLCLWPVTAEGSATRWWAPASTLPGYNIRIHHQWAGSTRLLHPQGDTSAGSSLSIKNLRRSNSTTQVNQQSNLSLRCQHTHTHAETIQAVQSKETFLLLYTFTVSRTFWNSYSPSFLASGGESPALGGLIKDNTTH